MKQLGPVDVALLPVGGTYTMNTPEAVRAAKIIRPRVVIPMHRGKADPLNFKKKVETVSKIRVAPLKIGESFILE